MGPKTDLRGSRRSQILDAATAVFAEKGFNQARMDDIVDRAGLSKGALYWYFESKDEIIAAILDQFFDREMDDLKALVAAGGPALTRLERFHALVAEDLRKFSRLLPITFEFYAVAARHQGVRAALRGYFRSYRVLLQNLVEQGVAAGEFRPVDADEIAIQLIALFEGVMLLEVVDPESVAWEPISGRGLHRLLASVINRDG